MYGAPPSRFELEGLGLLPSDIAAVEVFEENYPAYDLFSYMNTQWYIGMNGPTGMRYSVAHHWLDRKKLDPEEYEIRMDDLRIMEMIALRCMREQSKGK